MNPIPGQTNVRDVTLLDSDGAAVTDTGGATAQYYLKATTGTTAGKWWKAADGPWSATEVSGGGMTHDVRGQWSLSVASDAWTDQVEYNEYAVDSGGLAIVVGRQIRCEYPYPAPNAIADGLLDRDDAIESNVTLRQAVRIMAAVLAGKVSGAGSGDESFTGLDGSTLRVEVATDPAGNRTNVNYTPN